MKITSSYFFLLIFLYPFILSGQDLRIADYNTISWNAFTINHKVSEHWSTHGEFQWRRSEFLAEPQQNLYRFGVNYKVNDLVVFRIGAAYADTYPYGKVPLQAAAKLFPEYRTFQMLQISNPIDQFIISHRFMLEQRWLGQYMDPMKSKADSFIFLNRIRYMARLEYPLEKLSTATVVPYFAAYDEIMIGFGKNIGQNIFDQNRFGFLAGIDLQRNLRIEAGYLSQTLLFSRLVDGKQILQYNRGLIVNTNFKL
ncbi:DUF2490 domain-containing protein [Mongoliibacter ruber]|uniref:Uncharacterized protein DUF2490 n=1 Tax=Mongoliibacter ruber TaxID=1750599 RepID=A0A2T0WV25_9BACT|nr:DUF2490 domain-containing protein [Mongoliibacter ruber]PRY90535.1 uncharacterized protein DUF2490 [Mongoliibacter ruber]